MLVETYQEKAIRSAYLITQDKALARDVVQTTFIKVYKAIANFDPKRPFEPYFMRSVVNAAIRASRTSQKVVSLEQFHEDTGYLEELVSAADNPETLLEDKERAERIEFLIKQLSPEQRAVIVLKYYLGYSEGEMAQELDAPRGTIKSRLHKARQQLKRLLQVNHPHPLVKEELT